MRANNLKQRCPTVVYDQFDHISKLVINLTPVGKLNYPFEKVETVLSIFSELIDVFLSSYHKKARVVLSFGRIRTQL